MKTGLTPLLLLSLCLPGLAAQLPLPSFVAPAQLGVLDDILAETEPRWTYVSLQVSSFGGSLDISEPILRLDLNGRRSGGRFTFSGFAGDKHLFFSAYPNDAQDAKRGYGFFGSDVNLSLAPSGSNFWVSGTVGHRSMSFYLNRAGESFKLSGLSGTSLEVSGLGSEQSVSGYIDPGQFDQVCLGALGAVIGVASTIPEK